MKNKLLKTLLFAYIFLLTILILTKFNSIGEIMNTVYFIKQNREDYGLYNYNLHIFKTILSQIKRLDIRVNLINFLGNIVIFIPVGFLIKYIYNIKVISLIAISFLYVFLIESIQFLCLLGYFDIDDFILNIFGVLLGYFCYFIFKLIYGLIFKLKKEK